MRGLRVLDLHRFQSFSPAGGGRGDCRNAGVKGEPVDRSRDWGFGIGDSEKQGRQ
ncbi:hypothetical protein LC55x_2142 [Lysobacter capsici]|uniref:Uncharacterized protein n=1 Tax=Lysobacter capsici AZ78 TaxID=1444315 RepID=A0A108U6G9_9GAMM|nr:hypothetical protein LC55x_2142 [Lysobacter capsici]KWS03424.1 hypothetical protein AZ78_0971 [Lysobacter capsici AZ78]